VQFEWDETKNQINIRKHGIDFNDAIQIFEHPMLTALDLRHDYGEERWIALGWMPPVVSVVVYVERDGDLIRLISARKATKQEARRYQCTAWN
jgi:uncharacterized protein